MAFLAAPDLTAILKSKLPDVGTTIFTVMSALAQEHEAINLSQGFPDFDGPQALLDRVSHYLNQGYNQYPPMMGVAALRDAIAERSPRCMAGARLRIRRLRSRPVPRRRCSAPLLRWWARATR